MPAKVLVIGDCILDQWVFGTVERTSPEAPGVPVLKLSGETREMPGGAAAVAMMCHALGAEVSLAGVSGCRAGLVKLLNGVCTHRLVPDHRRLPTVKTRYCGAQGQLLRTDEESIETWDGSYWWHGGRCDGWLDSVLTKDVPWADIVLISDYGKGTLSRETLCAIIDAHDRVIVDPARGRNWWDYDAAWGLKCNQAEWAEWHEVPYAQVGPLEGWIARWMVVTHGAEPTELRHSSSKDSPQQFQSRASEVLDTVGAGDQFFATLGVMLAEGMELAETCRWANCAAGLGVEKFGTTPVNRAELEEEMAKYAVA